MTISSQLGKVTQTLKWNIAITFIRYITINDFTISSLSPQCEVQNAGHMYDIALPLNIPGINFNMNHELTVTD